MQMNFKNPDVDAYFESVKKFRSELESLRSIVLDCGLEETLKWHSPVYMHNGANLVVIGELSDHFVLSFFKGAILTDPDGILEKPGENTQSARVIRFKTRQEITRLKPAIRSYIFEAIDAENAGLKVKFKPISDREIPAELESKFGDTPELKKAFEALTPGRQRAYLLHFCGAKQPATRTSRIEKLIPKILQGKGLTDR